MKNLLSGKYSLWFIVLAIIIINLLATSLKFRIDLTAEKKFSISAPTKTILRNLDSTVTIDVFLKGDFPAVFRKLKNSTEDLLNEMKEYGGVKFRYRYILPNDFIPDSIKTKLATHLKDSLAQGGINQQTLDELKDMIVFDSLQKLGIQPYTLQVQAKVGDESSQRTIYPDMLVHYGKKVAPVDLLEGKTEFTFDPISGQAKLDEAKSINNAEALLEFKIADAINTLRQKEKPLVGYMIGNGEPTGPETYDLVTQAEKKYDLKILDINNTPAIPLAFKAIFIVKPSTTFADSDKIKIDQYIMHGGKVLWFLDMLHAESDSLAYKAETLAYDRGLDLDDLLFRYGIRINRDLLQDLQCDLSRMVVGSVGSNPQFADIPFNYYPLLNTSSSDPITKNLEPVLSQFANTIDTVKAEGVSKKILLESSDNSKTVATPAIISLQELKTIENRELYDKKHLPVSVFLEGEFQSLYANRASEEIRSHYTQLYGSFLQKAEKPNQMLVAADGDIVLNGYGERPPPYPMGYSRVQDKIFGNRAFFENALEYMTGNAGIISLRNKDVTLRLLNKEKVEDQRSLWQFINIAVPILLVILAGILYQSIRKRGFKNL